VLRYFIGPYRWIARRLSKGVPGRVTASTLIYSPFRLNPTPLVTQPHALRLIVLRSLYKVFSTHDCLRNRSSHSFSGLHARHTVISEVVSSSLLLTSSPFSPPTFIASLDSFEITDNCFLVRQYSIKHCLLSPAGLSFDHSILTLFCCATKNSKLSLHRYVGHYVFV
jgi:hypothetical protein